MKTLTEILFGFKTHKALDLLQINDTPPIELDDANDTNNDQNEPFEPGEPTKQPVKTYPIATQHHHTSYQYEQPEPIRRGETHQLPNLDKYRPAHIDAKDAIAFAALKMKERYDSRHQPLFFKDNDMVNLWLH
ncbi:hypothetical protein MMC06_005354 [Schaereria dolodes]|nr:hypothetical protein [Schaereria dolodes]